MMEEYHRIDCLSAAEAIAHQFDPQMKVTLRFEPLQTLKFKWVRHYKELELIAADYFDINTAPAELFEHAARTALFGDRRLYSKRVLEFMNSDSFRSSTLPVFLKRNHAGKRLEDYRNYRVHECKSLCMDIKVFPALKVILIKPDVNLLRFEYDIDILDYDWIRAFEKGAFSEVRNLAVCN